MRTSCVRSGSSCQHSSVVAHGQSDVAAQAIENQQRVQLSNSELAAAVQHMTGERMTNEDIATALALTHPQYVRHDQALADLAPNFAAWTDKSSVRALYELHQAWRKGEEAQSLVRAELPPLDVEAELTVAEARLTGGMGGTVAATEAAPEGAGVPAGAAAPAKSKRAGKSAPDVDAERVAKVRAWLGGATRPRPPLSV